MRCESTAACCNRGDRAPIANYDMPDWLRVSIGLETENEKFLSALQADTGEQ